MDIEAFLTQTDEPASPFAETRGRLAALVAEN